jgi:hypothetical protein
MRRAAFARTAFICIATVGLLATTSAVPMANAQGTVMFSQDFTLQETTTTAGAPGGGKTMTSTNYFSRNFMKRVSPDGNDTIIKLDDGKIITIDNKKKTYSIVTVQELNDMLEKVSAAASANKEQMEAMKKMMGQMSDSWSVTKLGPGEPIAGYKTEKYLLKGMMDMEMWVAPELKMPAVYYDAMKMRMRGNPMFDMSKMYDEFKKINGMTLKTVSTMKMMGMEVKTETVVTSVEKTPIPASVFEIPAGFKQVPSNMTK